MLDEAKDVARSARAGADDPLALQRQDVLLPLARAAGRGVPEAINTLVVSLGGSMLNTVRKVLGRGHPDVEDVTQDALVALVGSLHGFRGECTVAHFAHRITLLTALAARRRMRTRDRYTEHDTATESIADPSVSSPLMKAISSRRRQLVRELLDELSEQVAEALALHFVLGYTVEEIAAASALSPNTVWSRLRLGKEALRKKLVQDERLAELVGVPE
jgi:RNA polymerase sigma factor (sigma-70 family)